MPIWFSTLMIWLLGAYVVLVTVGGIAALVYDAPARNGIALGVLGLLTAVVLGIVYALSTAPPSYRGRD